MTRLDKGTEFAKFEARGGVLDGEHLTRDKVKEISLWPNRQQQLSLLLGQILSPGAKLLSQILAPGGALASQIEKKAQRPEEEEGRSSVMARALLRRKTCCERGGNPLQQLNNTGTARGLVGEPLRVGT